MTITADPITHGAPSRTVARPVIIATETIPGMGVIIRGTTDTAGDIDPKVP